MVMKDPLSPFSFLAAWKGSYGQFSVKSNTHFTGTLFLSICPREIDMPVHTDLHTNLHAAFF